MKFKFWKKENNVNINNINLVDINDVLKVLDGLIEKTNSPEIKHYLRFAKLSILENKYRRK